MKSSNFLSFKKVFESTKELELLNYF